MNKNFYNYKAIFNFLGEKLKRTVNENNYINNYNNDWNLLMDLVQAIEEDSLVGMFEISQPTIFIYISSEHSSKLLKDVEVDILMKTKIQAVYEACIEFITMYHKYYNIKIK